MPSSSSRVASISSTSASRSGDSEPGARRPDDLRTDLEELAVAALLRTLTTELRADVVELLQQALLAQLVLDVGADDSRSVLRAAT